MPGADMCQRCAMLDYGADEARGIRHGGTTQNIIDCLRDIPGGASTREIHTCAGERHYRQTQRALRRLLSRGRVQQFPCGDLDEHSSVCYELDDPSQLRPRRRRRR